MISEVIDKPFLVHAFDRAIEEFQMNRRPFFLTIDTEMDHSKYRTGTTSAKNLQKLYHLVEYIDRHKIYLTLFVTFDVLRHYSANFKDFMTSKYVELGIHPHPEEMPKDISHRMQSTSLYDYPLAALEAFLDLFIALFKEKDFDVPRIFRAGRYRLPVDLIPILLKKNITVDSSVCPFINWSIENGPDYSHITPSIEYYHGIKEVPITIVQPENLKMNAFYKKFGTVPLAEKSLLIRKLRRLILGREPFWLRPTFSDINEMKEVVLLSKKYNAKYVCMMLHSYELKEGCSPQAKTKHDAQRIYNRLIVFLDQLDDLNLISMPMNKIAT